MATSNDMPEFHSVKVSLTENTPVSIPKAKQLPVADAVYISANTLAASRMPLTLEGGQCHV
ncbi:hypothetical protein SG34_023055 [Thalassomonas viridans]|uniref:Uncharacterized protein n=1 Tax=Thalassomonas viridans TaxID=137584 RepID=A0AAE9Z2U1_9GAMM|nr:hypothetical protein [Thalassomonas viridans]WDE04193.1 hypothetical protein SG34_023055 [Thalassomonas viridans]